MTALIRYQLELLLRSQRWLPPFLGYAALLAIGMQEGSALLDGLGLGAALLVPITAWWVRCAVTADPPQARTVLVAARGAARVQLASLLAALLAGTVLMLLGTGAVWALSGQTVNDPRKSVPVPPALLAGLLAGLACVLTGLAVGALCHRPVLLRAGYGLLGVLGLSALALVAPGLPGNAAVRALVTGSEAARVELPVAGLLGALLLAAAAVAASVVLAGRRTE
ncbi:ABC transporter [Kitasatospora sp. NPDC006697]|uniref:ABC transporter n=1 Tax=Kitasatospora sp. NPDC006697 TaxID=3364020 RepID=UPI00368842F8